MMRANYAEECAHPGIAIRPDNLRLVYLDQGKLEEAVKIYQRSIEMERGTHGEECAHPGIPTTLHNLELVYQDQRKLKDGI